MARSVNQFAFNNADATQSTLTSPIYLIDDCLYGSFLSVSTGSITGTLVMQVSNDPVTDQGSIANWATLPSSYTLSIAGAGATITLLPEICFRWTRFVYTKTIATAGATLTVAFKAQGNSR